MCNIDELLFTCFNVRRRFVEKQDAGFILSLRTDEELGRYLSATCNELLMQELWIEAYKNRENDQAEFYFIFEHINGDKCGLSRIYNLDEKSFEIGSWLFSKKAPVGVSILADLATRDYAFETFNFNFCRFEVRKENKAVVNYHKRFKPDLVDEDELNYYFELSKDNYFKCRNQILKMYNNGVE